MTPPLHHPLGSVGIAILLALPLTAQEVEPNTDAGSGNVLLSGASIPYEEIAPGIERALLHGNPDVEGELFTFRLRVAGTFEMEPHTHPVPEHMTVLSGRFFVGIGEVMDRTSAVEYGPGSYVVIDAEVPAYMWTEGTTVVQIHGVGPLRTVFVPKR
jgi:mannose-6-phosphate isomerase-like protein (cupin superfamily)